MHGAGGGDALCRADCKGPDFSLLAVGPSSGVFLLTGQGLGLAELV